MNGFLTHFHVPLKSLCWCRSESSRINHQVCEQPVQKLKESCIAFCYSFYSPDELDKNGRQKPIFYPCSAIDIKTGSLFVCNFHVNHLITFQPLLYFVSKEGNYFPGIFTEYTCSEQCGIIRHSREKTRLSRQVIEICFCCWFNTRL